MSFRDRDDLRATFRPAPPMTARRSRYVWRLLLLLAIVVVAAAGWTFIWYRAADATETTIAGWRAREAASGRVHTCERQTIGGYPFRIEVRCDRAGIELRDHNPPLRLALADILFAAQVYQPTLLISEFTGPLTVSESGKSSGILATWQLGRSSLRGTPRAPERVSIVLDDALIERPGSSGAQTLVKAKRIELHGRIAGGSVNDHPVIEVVLRTTQAAAPVVHPLAAIPVDADIAATLHGLKNFRAKPWSERFREIQAAGGRIEIASARLAQGETVAVGSGALSLNPNGKLDGQMRVTVAGLEPFLNALGTSRDSPAAPAVDKLAGMLDRFAPGLGTVARQKAGSGLAAGITMMGEPTELEGKPAVSLPLRFTDGAMFLGPIPLGQIDPLF